MSTFRTESVPQRWDDETDGAFFRITAALFSGDFTFGAGVLLGTYDADAVRESSCTRVRTPDDAPVGTRSPQPGSFAVVRPTA